MNALARGARRLRDRIRYTGPTVDGVRPLRAGVMVSVGFGALIAMYGLVSANVLAVNFTTSDKTFQVYSNYIQGISAGGFVSQNKAATAAGQQGVAEIGIRTAELNGLCAIAHEQLPVVETQVSLIIKAGASVASEFVVDPDDPTNFVDGDGHTVLLNDDGTLDEAEDTIDATDLFLNTTDLKGYGNNISGLNLGQNASDVATQAGLNNGTPGTGGSWPSPYQNPPAAGGFGLTAQHLNVGYLDGSSYGINLAGSISLPSLHIQVLPGWVGQEACPTSGS